MVDLWSISFCVGFVLKRYLDEDKSLNTRL